MDTHFPGQPGPGPTDGPTTPPPYAAPKPTGAEGFFTAIRRTGLYRSDDRWIGGVAGGIAGRFGIDPLLVRGLFGVSFLLGGLGLVAYGIGWLLLPEQSDGRIHAEELVRGDFDVALLGVLGMVVVGLNRGDGWFGWWSDRGLGWLTGLLWAVSLAVVAVLVVIGINQSRNAKASGAWPWTPGPPHDAPGAPTSPYAPPAPYAAAPASPHTAPRPTTPYPAPAAQSTPGPSAPYGPSTPYAPYAASAPPSDVPPLEQLAQLVDGPPAPPRKPRVRSASAATLGLVTALILFTLAGLMVAERFGAFDGPVLLTAAGVAVILLGLGIVYAGLRGRSSGALGALAIIAIIAAAPVALLNKPVWNAGGAWRAIGDETFVAGTRDAAASGYNLGIGDSTVDLTGVPLTDETLLVPVSVGVGEVRILVPEGSSVSAEVRAGVGGVTWQVDGETRRSSGVGIGTQRFSTEDVTKGGEAQLSLSVDIGAGDIVIEEGK